MRTAIAVMLLVSGCGSDAGAPDAAEIECSVPTSYLGAEHDCMAGAGVCIANGPAVTCYAKCSTGPSGACSAGFLWMTQATTSAEVCYCVPAP
jgi:hypothetical protein